MNLKDRRKARRLLKELGCLTEFKLEMKKQRDGNVTFKNLDKQLAGAFNFSEARLSSRYWAAKIMENIEQPFGWKI